MPILTPDSPEQTIKEAQQDAKNELPDSNPWLESGLLRALTVMVGRRGFDIFEAVQRSVDLSFPFKAVGRFLQFWADLKNLKPKSAQKASGPVTFTGTIGNTVPADSIWKVGTTEYLVDSNVDVESNVRNVVSLVAVGTLATCTTTEEHNLRDGMSFALDGENTGEWNQPWDNVSVIGGQSFQFEVPTGLPSPAVGTMTITFDAALGNVTSKDTAAYTNLSNGTALEASQTHAGIDDIAGTQYVGITGGTDDETRDEYSARIIDRWKNPETPFNSAKIINVVKGVGGGKNTRVWVRRVRPKIGAVSIYFVRDEDESIMPDISEIAEVKAAVVAISSPQTDEVNIHVNDPFVAKVVDTVITGVTPATSTMRESLEARVRTYFRGGGLIGGVGEGENLDIQQYRTDLYQTVDFQTGERIRTFNMTSPVDDIQVDENEIVIEGNTSVS